MENIRTLRNGLRINILRSAQIPPPEKFLSADELKKFSGFRIEKRKSDWLGGRYAAKTLLRELLDPSLSLREIEISYDLFGRPVWCGGLGLHLLTITHSGPFCAAAARTGPCVFLGIDLEKIEPRVKPWYEDYFHKSELALEVTSNKLPLFLKEGPGEIFTTFHSSNSPSSPFTKRGTYGKGNSYSIQSPVTNQSPATGHRSLAAIHLATRLWTKKEALLKALGLGLKADPLDIKIGKEIQFLNAALKRYKELGRPQYLLETSRFETEYYLSAVADTG
ncbi:MAG: 4'-phosphopantetheinyl transferase superfamily protein [Elusimicrobia bacterium]|nr:4'-phosphopantetheinyl transferase superfamily protein [Elusimicrobiota bacterium]